MKNVIVSFLSLAVVLSMSVSAAHAENIYDDTRYNDSSPLAPVEDYLNNLNDGITNGYNVWCQVVHDYLLNGVSNATEEMLRTYEKFSNSVKDGLFGADAFDSVVHAQRVKDLVDYANQSTTGLITGQKVYAFIAKRKLFLGSHNGEQQYELDTLYFWKDDNHTTSVDFTGVTIGNFFLQPNTFYVTRQFSNGDFDCFYGDTKQLSFHVSSESSNYVSTPFTITFNAGQTYSVINSDGSISSLTFPASNSTSHTWSTLSFKILDNNLNAIDLNGFQRQMQYYPSAGQYISDGRLSNAQLMFNNASKSDGGMMRPNNYSGSAEGWGTWYLSSGSFIGSTNNQIVVAPRSFTVDNDPTNYDPRKPPATYNVDPLLYTDTQLTPQNVNNYNDYGVTYNSNTNKFELDVSALAAGIAGLISPDFKGNFDLVYDNQPDIGGNDWTNLNNNYNTDFENKINDLDLIVKDLLPAEPFTVPYYAPVNTSAFIPAQYPTVPTGTIPPTYGGAMASTLNTGWDLFDSLDILAFLCPLIVFLLIWKLTGK